MNNQIIIAEKNGKEGKFSSEAWKQLGKNKSGWTIKKSGIVKQVNIVKAPTYVENVDYEKLLNQAKGFLADGKSEEGLARYEAAYKIKPNALLKSSIDLLKTSIEEAKTPPESKGIKEDGVKDEKVIIDDVSQKNQDYDEAFAAGEESEKKQDFVGALALYKTAASLFKRVAVKKAIKRMEAEIQANKDLKKN